MTHVVDRLQRTEPKQIVFTIADGGVEYDNGQSTSVDRTKVWARAGGKAVFVIQNNDDVAYEVTIPFNEFTPKTDCSGAPADPINERASGKDTVSVGAGDVDVLTYVLKPAAHFPFSDTRRVFTYKYNLYLRKSSAVDRTMFDPDLEVTP